MDGEPGEPVPGQGPTVPEGPAEGQNSMMAHFGEPSQVPRPESETATPQQEGATANEQSTEQMRSELFEQLKAKNQEFEGRLMVSIPTRDNSELLVFSKGQSRQYNQDGYFGAHSSLGAVLIDGKISGIVKMDKGRLARIPGAGAGITAEDLKLQYYPINARL